MLQLCSTRVWLTFISLHAIHPTTLNNLVFGVTVVLPGYNVCWHYTMIRLSMCGSLTQLKMLENLKCMLLLRGPEWVCVLLGGWWSWVAWRVSLLSLRTSMLAQTWLGWPSAVSWAEHNFQSVIQWTTRFCIGFALWCTYLPGTLQMYLSGWMTIALWPLHHNWWSLDIGFDLLPVCMWSAYLLSIGKCHQRMDQEILNIHVLLCQLGKPRYILN